MAFYTLRGNRQKQKNKMTSKCDDCHYLNNGFVHSIESLGTVDGPGIRTVVFLSGCPMACQYCHNVDVTVPGAGTKMTPEELIQKIILNKPYFSAGGGVTFSGGEPLFQTCFLQKCLALCQAHQIHTTVDTSLFTASKNLDKVILHTDLFLVSIKQLGNEEHKQLTGVGNEIILRNLEKLAQEGKPVWIRYVLLPGITDSPEYLKQLVTLVKKTNTEKIEILPYHKTGQDKWRKIGKPYEFEHVKVPNTEEIDRVESFFETAGFEVLCNR